MRTKGRAGTVAFKIVVRSAAGSGYLLVEHCGLEPSCLGWCCWWLVVVVTERDWVRPEQRLRLRLGPHAASLQLGLVRFSFSSSSSSATAQLSRVQFTGFRVSYYKRIGLPIVSVVSHCQRILYIILLGFFLSNRRHVLMWPTGITHCAQPLPVAITMSRKCCRSCF